MKLCFILGTRPQVIKAAALHPALLAHGIDTVLVDTGQHTLAAMAADLWAELGLPAPGHRLRPGGATRDAQLATLVPALDAILARERPDAVLVVGDTNSTLAGARAAAGRGLPVAHVEAGLRSGEPGLPEERNRLETDALATLLFCPSARARAQLALEGRTAGVHVVGDVMLDVLSDAVSAPPEDALARDLGLAAGAYAVATVHRAGTTDDERRLERVFEALAALPMPVVCPVHPRTTQRLAAMGYHAHGALRPIPPLGYRAMTALVSRAFAVLTDSGGLQREAYWLGVPCLTLRDATEWPETVEAGWNRLVGIDPAAIGRAFAGLARPAARPDVYGLPGASRRVAAVLARQ